MSADHDLQPSFERFGEVVAEYAFARCQEALALERDRHDAEIAELRTEVRDLHVGVQRLAGAIIDTHPHSVKVPK